MSQARSRFLRELAAATDPGAGVAIVDAAREYLIAGWAALGERQRRKRCEVVAARYGLRRVPWFAEALAVSAGFWLVAPASHPWRRRFVFPVLARMPGAGAVGTEAEAENHAFEQWRERKRFTAWRAENPAPPPPRPGPPLREVGPKAYRALVSYHCLGRPLSEVAPACGYPTRAKASEAIHRAGAAVGITPRRGQRTGRPKGNTSERA